MSQELEVRIFNIIVHVINQQNKHVDLCINVKGLFLASFNPQWFPKFAHEWNELKHMTLTKTLNLCQILISGVWNDLGKKKTPSQSWWRLSRLVTEKAATWGFCMEMYVKEVGNIPGNH